MLGINLSICAIAGSFLEKIIEISDDAYKWEYLCIMSESYMDTAILQALTRYTCEFADLFCSDFSISPNSPKRFLGPCSSFYNAKNLLEENKE